MQVASITSAWGVHNSLQLPKEELKYPSKAWVLAGAGAPVAINYTMQVIISELYDDGVTNDNLTGIAVKFLDQGMDYDAPCSVQQGGCSLQYSWKDNTTFLKRGIQYGPFDGGKPNIAAVSCA